MTSVRARLLVSLGSNVARAALSFLTGLIVARALMPSTYGGLMFLLGSFVALRPLLDMGASNAFFTFMSQRRRSAGFVLYYFGWLALQLLVALLVVGFLLPDSIFQRVWLGYQREVVVLALMASFGQQQLWQAVGQVGESARQTFKVQMLNMLVVIFYTAAVALLAVLHRLSIDVVLGIMITQYGVGAAFAWLVLRRSWQHDGQPREELRFWPMLREYGTYCRPLIALSIISFAFDFADKWLLQRFGGAAQQGYFQVANQFSAISLLATASILNVFWKEIAAAWAENDRVRVGYLYKKVNRSLVMLGAILTGFLLPWSKEIVLLLLGDMYLKAWPVFAIMLLYPIHQSMGQIGGTMLYATGQTRKYMAVSAGVMLFSIPFSYFMLAPQSSAGIPGLGLGAAGMAAKMVLLGIASVNVQAWVIARFCNWKMDWLFQVVGIGLMLVLGFAARWTIGIFLETSGSSFASLLLPVLATSLLYGALVLAALWRLPWLLGMEQTEMARLLGWISSSFKRKKLA